MAVLAAKVRRFEPKLTPEQRRRRALEAIAERGGTPAERELARERLRVLDAEAATKAPPPPRPPIQGFPRMRPIRPRPAPTWTKPSSYDAEAAAARRRHQQAAAFQNIGFRATQTKDVKQTSSSMARGYFTLDERGEPIPCFDVLEWGRWFATADRTIGDDHVGRVRVSTCFIGLDPMIRLREPTSPSYLWETVVFDGESTLDAERYKSKADAVAGHQRWLANVKENLQ